MKKSKKLISLVLTFLMVVAIIPLVSTQNVAHAASVSNYVTCTNCSNYRATVNLVINGVSSGTSNRVEGNYESGITQYSISNPVYLKSSLKPNSATIYVDRSIYSNLDQLNINVQLGQFTVHSKTGTVRWGIQIFGGHSSSSRAYLGSGAERASSNGYSYYIYQSNSSHTGVYSAETGDGNLNTSSSTTSGRDMTFGPYNWYLKGDAPAVGASAYIDVAGVCVVMAGDNNYQMLSEWTHLTITGTCSHSAGSYLSSSGGGTHCYKCNICNTVTSTVNCSGGSNTCTSYALCSTCGYAYGSLKAHSYTGAYRNDGTTHSRLCVNGCNQYGNAQAHSYSTFVSTVTKANCTANKVDKYKCACGATTNITVSGTQLNHSYTGDYKDNGNGTHSRKCVNGCAQYGDAQAHNYSTYVSTASNATCTTNRFDTYKCVCGATTQKEIANTATGHRFDKANGVAKASEGKHYFKCANCDVYGVGTTAGATEDCTGGIATCTATATCSVCSNAYGNINATNHDFTKQDQSKKATDATCTEKATYYYTCSRCNAQGTTTYEYGEVDGTNHSFTKQDQSKKATDATCTEKATYYYTCSRCNAQGRDTYEYGEVDGTNHSFTKQDQSKKATDATCTEKATYYYTCSRCNAQGRDTYEYGEVDSTNHNFSAEVATQAHLKDEATCTTAPVYYKSCTRCQENGTDTFTSGDALGHNFNGEAQNAGEGKHNFKCERCDAYGVGTQKDATADCTGGTATCTQKAICETCSTAYGNVDADNHDFTKQDQSKKATDATCTEKATYYYTCSRCNAQGTDTYEYGDVDSTNHNFSAEVATQAHLKAEATCTTAPVYYKSCTRCQENGTNTFTSGDALGHNFNGEAQNAGEGKHNFKCERCDAYGVGTQKDATADCTGGTATCTQKAICETCSTAYGNVDADNHDFTKQDQSKKATDATCTEKATYYYTCSRCNAQGTDTYEYGEVDSTNHDFSAEVATQAHLKDEATCTTAPVYYKSCTRCQENGTDTFTSGDALGHNFNGEAQNAGEGKHNFKCERCDAYGTGTTKDATADCTGGTANCVDKAVCESCATAYGNIDSANHKSPADRDAVPAKCTEKGFTAGVYCTACEKWISGHEETNPTGHKWNEGEWSFSEDGKTAEITFTCTNDGNHKQTVTATVTSEVKTPAECTVKGTTTYTATAEFEGDTYTDTKDVVDIAPLGHDYIEHEAVAPTCAKAGNKAYTTCSRCDYTTFEEVPTTDHIPGTPVNENRVYGNGSAGSYEKVCYCTFCGKELSRTSETVDYDCPACRMTEIADQLGADTAVGKLVTVMHTVLHAFFGLFDKVIKG